MQFISVETYNEIWASDFEEFVRERFNVEYRYSPTMDYPGQDTYWKYEVGMGAYDGDYNWDEVLEEETPFDRNKFLMDLATKPEREKPAPYSILEYLYEIGDIPAGNYLFLVWW